MVRLNVLHTPLELLTRVLARIRLSKTQHDRAVATYESVTSWLADPASQVSRFEPTIYPQGSMRLGTAVKPTHGNEFDLDVVCQLVADPRVYPANQVYQLILGRLQEHGDLSKRLDPRPTCVRLTYAGDFHLDVVPACPAGVGQSIVIPQEEPGRESAALAWKETNPIGYADWFESRDRLMLVELAKRGVEPPPSYDAYEAVTPLRLAVQFVKHRRNRWYGTDKAPSSILITTLLAREYGGQPASLESMHALVAAVGRFVSDTRVHLVVPNPSLPTENLAASLDASDRHRFARFLEQVLKDLEQLQQQSGLPSLAESLRRMFEPSLVDDAVGSLATDVQNRRESGTLRSVGAAAIAIAHRPHTFFGGRG